jgi:hypothetical protein
MTERERIRKATLEGQRLQGCVCDPYIDIAGGDGFYSGVVAHDKWCPLSPYAARQAGHSPSETVLVVPAPGRLRGWFRGRLNHHRAYRVCR